MQTSRYLDRQTVWSFACRSKILITVDGIFISWELTIHREEEEEDTREAHYFYSIFLFCPTFLLKEEWKVWNVNTTRLTLFGESYRILCQICILSIYVCAYGTRIRAFMHTRIITGGVLQSSFSRQQILLPKMIASQIYTSSPNQGITWSSRGSLIKRNDDLIIELNLFLIAPVSSMI